MRVFGFFAFSCSAGGTPAAGTQISYAQLGRLFPQQQNAMGPWHNIDFGWFRMISVYSRRAGAVPGTGSGWQVFRFGKPVPLLKLPPGACPGATGKNVCMIVFFLLSCLDHWASIGAISIFAPGRDLQGLGHWRWSLPRGKVPVSWPVSKHFLGAPPLSSKCLEVVSCFFFCFYVYFSLTFINGPPTTLIFQSKWMNFLGSKSNLYSRNLWWHHVDVGFLLFKDMKTNTLS